ncbi:MAG TPA: hypothetical protein VH592_26465 [Gemmataceae bacterium]|jgi:hypothetical protein
MTILAESLLRFSVIDNAGRQFRWLVFSHFFLLRARYFAEMDTMKRPICALSVLLLAVLLVACAALAVPAPKPSLKEWGKPVDPDQDCKIRFDEGVLSIEMPGTEHEYDPYRTRFNAPHIILREIEREFDLQVRIRIDSPPSTQSSVEGHPAYVSAGFLMLYPDSPLFVSPRYELVCERVDYGVIQQRIGIDDFPIGIDDWPADRRGLHRLRHPQIEEKSRKGVGEDGCVLLKDWVYNSTARENGGPRIGLNRFQQLALVLIDRGWRYWPMPKKADSVYLRMEQGDRGIRISISPSGEKWTQLTGHTWGMHPRPKVGLAAYSTSSEPSRVRFDQIKLWRGKKKE